MFLRHTAPGILWALLIGILCGMPGNQIPGFFLWDLFNFDKAVHAFLFLFQVLLLGIGFRKQSTFPSLRYRGVTIALTFGIFYGIFTEVMQKYYFTGRHFDLMDMSANIIGSFLGAGTFYLIYGRRK